MLLVDVSRCAVDSVDNSLLILWFVYLGILVDLFDVVRFVCCVCL